MMILPICLPLLKRIEQKYWSLDISWVHRSYALNIPCLDYITRQNIKAAEKERKELKTVWASVSVAKSIGYVWSLAENSFSTNWAIQTLVVLSNIELSWTERSATPGEFAVKWNFLPLIVDILWVHSIITERHRPAFRSKWLWLPETKTPPPTTKTKKGRINACILATSA